MSTTTSPPVADADDVAELDDVTAADEVLPGPDDGSPDEPDHESFDPGPLPLRISIATFFPVVAAAIMVGGIFKGVPPRVTAIVAGALAIALAVVASRVRRASVANGIVVVGLFGIGILLVATSGLDNVFDLGTQIAESRAEGDVLRPPVPFSPGWQAIIAWLVAMLGFTAAWTGIVLKRPSIGVLLPLPIAGIATISVPESQQVASGIAVLVLFAIGMGVLSSGDNAGDDEAGPSMAFEVRRSLRQIPLIAVITVALFFLSKANFLFPAPLIDPTQEPQAPKTVPLSEVVDRVLFTTDDCGITGPWRIGSLDVYTGEDWRLPPFADNQLTEIPASGIVNEELQPGVACEFEVLGLDGSVLPGLPNATGIRTTGPLLSYDSRSGNIRVSEGQIEPGLVYTVVAAQVPTIEQLTQAQGSVPPEVVQFTDIPPAPPGVQDLIAQAPGTSKWEQFDFLRTWVLDNVVATGQGVPIPITPDRVEEMIVGEQKGSPYEIVAAQAMLARWIDVPSRIGYGFDGGEEVEGRDGYLEVRPKHGASFPEVYFPGFGWLPVIGTPRQAEASVGSDQEQNEDPNILPSNDIAVELYLPTVTPPPSVFTQQLRKGLLIAVPSLLLLVLVYYLYPAVRKLLMRARRRSWAARSGARARIALSYAEFRDLATDLGFGDASLTPLEFVDRLVDDEEHLQFAWLVTRTLWGDLSMDVTEDHAAHAEELSRSLRRRMSQAQPVSLRLVAAVSRLSLRSPFSPEIDRSRTTSKPPSEEVERELAHAGS